MTSADHPPRHSFSGESTHPRDLDIAVLLCTHNGASFLEEQLRSIQQQSVNWRLVASDDASNDDTRKILESFAARFPEGRCVVLDGPARGHVTNFLSLVCQPIDADLFAFCDQDDIWEPEKLARAIEVLGQVSPDEPALYCSRTRLIDEEGGEIGLSPLFVKPPSFANALIHNVGGGNTMVCNKSAMALLRRAGEQDVVAHDWWAYLLISGAGGRVLYDPEPNVRYRQHRGNVVGSGAGWLSRVGRYFELLRGRNKAWNDLNAAALQRVQSLLTAENAAILSDFCAARDVGVLRRFRGMRKAGVYAQSSYGNVALFTAILLNKILVDVDSGTAV